MDGKHHKGEEEKITEFFYHGFFLVFILRRMTEPVKQNYPLSAIQTVEGILEKIH